MIMTLNGSLKSLKYGKGTTELPLANYFAVYKKKKETLTLNIRNWFLKMSTTANITDSKFSIR